MFENDGMPQMICKTCRAQTLQAYTFKTDCKKADDALKVYLATGSLVRPWSQDELNEVCLKIPTLCICYVINYFFSK